MSVTPNSVIASASDLAFTFNFENTGAATDPEPAIRYSRSPSGTETTSAVSFSVSADNFSSFGLPEGTAYWGIQVINVGNDNNVISECIPAGITSHTFTLNLSHLAYEAVLIGGSSDPSICLPPTYGEGTDIGAVLEGSLEDGAIFSVVPTPSDSDGGSSDITPPSAPSVVTINDDEPNPNQAIYSGNVTNGFIIGHGGDIGDTAHYTFTDTQGHTITGSTPVADLSAERGITGPAFVVGDLVLSALSDGTITLSVFLTDAAGNMGPTIATSTTKDVTPPTIMLSGSAAMSVALDNTFIDPEAIATDAVDGSVTPVVTGTVDTNRAGTYTLTYTATDAHSNASTRTRDVVVSGTALVVTPTTNEDGTRTGIQANAATSTTNTPAGNMTVEMPANLMVTGPSEWDGTINLPLMTTSYTLTPDSGSTASAVEAIEVGAGDIPLTFDHAVKLTFTGQAGKLIGWSQAVTFHQITTTCDSAINPTLTAGADCKLDVDGDLVVWTKHFSTFITYTQTVTPAPAPTPVVGNSNGSILVFGSGAPNPLPGATAPRVTTLAEDQGSAAVPLAAKVPSASTLTESVEPIPTVTNTVTESATAAPTEHEVGPQPAAVALSPIGNATPTPLMMVAVLAVLGGGLWFWRRS